MEGKTSEILFRYGVFLTLASVLVRAIENMYGTKTVEHAKTYEEEHDPNIIDVEFTNLD